MPFAFFRPSCNRTKFSQCPLSMIFGVRAEPSLSVIRYVISGLDGIGIAAKASFLFLVVDKLSVMITKYD